MQIDIHPSFLRQPATFTVVIAPEPLLIRALQRKLRSTKEPVLYLCGNETRLFTQLVAVHRGTRLRRWESLADLVSVITEPQNKCIFIEYDGSLFSDQTDHLELFPSQCTTAAHEYGATIVLFSPDYDVHLCRIAEEADRVFLAAPAHHKKRRHPPAGCIAEDQKTLGSAGI
jgi:hypothetical protein